MNIKDCYKQTIKSTIWKYYDGLQDDIDLGNTENCKNFIKQFVCLSEKSDSSLYNDINDIFRKSPKRMNHIVSTFFLGIMLFCSPELDIGDEIVTCLTRFKAFGQLDIKKEFSYLWFMTSLFHDLGYEAEQNGRQKLNYKMDCNSSVPCYYASIYKQYYCMMKKKNTEYMPD